MKVFTLHSEASWSMRLNKAQLLLPWSQSHHYRCVGGPFFCLNFETLSIYFIASLWKTILQNRVKHVSHLHLVVMSEPTKGINQIWWKALSHQRSMKVYNTRDCSLDYSHVQSYHNHFHLISPKWAMGVFTVRSLCTFKHLLSLFFKCFIVYISISPSPFGKSSGDIA